MKITGLVLGAALALGAMAGVANATTIDFSGYSDGTQIGNLYASEGLTFSGATIGTCSGGCPLPNINGNFAYGEGSFTIDFSHVQSDITFQTVSYSSTLAEAYNAQGQLVASVVDNEGYPISGDIDSLVAPGIVSVVFSYDGGYNVPAITNLTFAGVPEPSAWALMLAGVAGIGGMLRQAKKTARARLSAATAA